ncbi:hypothetical protein K0B03_01670 [Patescibacteria group bacterium]|nr:hypothetical protein [Patescibacteria group bacterium]
MENEVYRKENFTRESSNFDSQYHSLDSQEIKNPSAQVLLSPREILRRSWFLYKSKFKTLLGLSIIKPLGSLIIAISTPILYALFLYLIPFLSLEKSREVTIINILNLIFIVMILLSFLVMIWFVMWNQVAVIYAIRNSEENINIKESFKRGRPKAKQALVISLLTGFIVSAGFALFFIPGLIFSIWFTFVLFVVVEEEYKGMAVLFLCREYVRGYWWQVFWRNLYIGAIIIGLEICFIILESTFLFFKLPVLGDVVSLANGIIIVIIAPLVIIYQFLLYKNIKAIKGDFVFTPSRGLKIKLIIVSILGSILGILIVISIFILISFFGNNLDQESKAYVDMTVPIIISSWDSQELISRASWELRESTPSEKIELSFIAFSNKFGQFREYKGSTGEISISHENITATYDAEAVFENDLAVIQIQIIKTDDDWKIRGFQIWPISDLDDWEKTNINLEQRNQYFADLREIENLWSGEKYQQSLDKASEVLPKAQTKKEKAWAYYWIGLSQYKLQNYAVAESELQLAVKLDENYAAPYVTLAAIEMNSKGNYSKALEYSQECLSLDPEYGWCYHSYGLALFSLGREDEGIKALEKSVSLDSDNYFFRDSLARAEQMMKQNKGAENNISINQNDEKRKTDLATISILLQEYKNKNGQYPISPAVTKLNQINNEVVNQIKSISPSSAIPIDSQLGNYYGYVSSDGKNFELTAKLENMNDPDCSLDIMNLCIYKLQFDL